MSFVRTDDYLGYCKHGVCIFWQSGETKVSAADFKSVYEMRRGTVEQARKELNECPECKAKREKKVRS